MTADFVHSLGLALLFVGLVIIVLAALPVFIFSIKTGKKSEAMERDSRIVSDCFRKIQRAAEDDPDPPDCAHDNSRGGGGDASLHVLVSGILK